jgi:L-amino acid N-acyltransferase YncA
MQIRLAQDADAPAMTAIYTPFVTSTPTSFELEPPTPEEMIARLHKTLRKFPWLVVEHEGAVIGYAYASQHRERAAYQWAVDVSAYIHEQWRGKGIGRALYTALFGGLREQGYFHTYAGIALPNPASVALHEAMGMTPVGIYRQVGFKLGAWHDVGWWQGTLQELALHPSPPLPVTDVLHTEAWDTWMAAGLAKMKVAESQS